MFYPHSLLFVPLSIAFPSESSPTVSNLPAIIFGCLLGVCAVMLAVWQRRVWAQGGALLPESDPNRQYAARQLRRRLQVSAALLLLAVIIPAGDFLSEKDHQGVVYIAFLAIVVVLVMWIVLMAIGDYAITAAHTRVDMARLRRERQSLEAELARYQAGRPGDPPPSAQ